MVFRNSVLLLTNLEGWGAKLHHRLPMPIRRDLGIGITSANLGHFFFQYWRVIPIQPWEFLDKWPIALKSGNENKIWNKLLVCIAYWFFVYCNLCVFFLRSCRLCILYIDFIYLYIYIYYTKTYIYFIYIYIYIYVYIIEIFYSPLYYCVG